MSWIEPNIFDTKKPYLLSPNGKMRALPYALISRDVYSDYDGGPDLGGASRLIGWAQYFAKSTPRANFSRVEKAEIAVGSKLGFSAALYRVVSPFDNLYAIAFQGTNISTPTKGFGTILADISATLDVVNKVGEPAIDTIIRSLGLPAPFSGFLNISGSPGTAYDLADLFARQAAIEFGRPSLILTGHSLGGGIAQYAAMKNNLKAVVFNSAGAGLTSPMANPAETLVRIDTTGGNFNYLVTDFSDVASRHYGARYLIGPGGHGIDVIINSLRNCSLGF